MSSMDEAGKPSRWGGYLAGIGVHNRHRAQDEVAGSPKWSMGILNERDIVEVPGSVLLLAAHCNKPLGLHNIHARTSHSSIPTGFPVDIQTRPGSSSGVAKKKTDDGTVILEPQPDDSENDPLNWPSWRRDAALLSLGFYCMIGGGITPLIAAGFTDVAHDFDVSVEKVALTTGFCMMGLGIGSVIASPTAILYGKRPVYLVGAILFIGTSLLAGFSPSFSSLLAARVFQGISISPVECLPSATIAEIFFLHERAYRIGIYTLLLLGGKNMVPLVSAVIISRFGWRWAFFIVSMVVGLGFVLLFLFVPETFWDRTPTRKASQRPSLLHRLSSRHNDALQQPITSNVDGGIPGEDSILPRVREHSSCSCVDISTTLESESRSRESPGRSSRVNADLQGWVQIPVQKDQSLQVDFARLSPGPEEQKEAGPPVSTTDKVTTDDAQPISTCTSAASTRTSLPPRDSPQNLTMPCENHATSSSSSGNNLSNLLNVETEKLTAPSPPKINAYTHNLRQRPARSFTQQLKPYHGRLNNDNWFKVMVRPFILFAYPAVLWSAIIYSCSIGWLIVISETMAIIYRNPTGYSFTALQTGLIYVSPFVGAILGTGVAGKISDILVRAMSRRNGGLYEPEFRLIMAVPILITTCIGLIGFGWSAEEKDRWIIPTLFFGIVSFGCSLGSTTSITFCVDSYRQYAGEALVTLNFTKNIMHGLIFSLFVSHWLEKDGSKSVYMWIGIIHLIVCLSSLPMYIFGKRARMWTVRKNLMEKF